MFDAASALELVEGFEPGDDGLAAKSQELIGNLLRHTKSPFLRDQFEPGHITCTAFVLSPDGESVLLMHHHRHQRWLLPGGHVELDDPSLAASARREAFEETGILLPDAETAFLVGMDVHGIPPKKGEPYHLHHDLVFGLRALNDSFACTEEAPRIEWCKLDQLIRYSVPPNIIRSALRAGGNLEGKRGKT